MNRKGWSMKKKKGTPKEFNKQKKLEKNVRRSLDIEKSFKGNNKEEGRYYFSKLQHF